jgi:hypothetical protein
MTLRQGTAPPTPNLTITQGWVLERAGVSTCAGARSLATTTTVIGTVEALGANPTNIPERANVDVLLEFAADAAVTEAEVMRAQNIDLNAACPVTTGL